MPELHELINGFAQAGAVEWIGVRPARREPLVARPSVRIVESGLEGDRRRRPGKRAVTLIQWEHFPVIAALCGQQTVKPGQLRRNIAVSGINLLGLRGREFKIGGAVLKGTGLCAPCSHMEAELGTGGYAAVRGHGGITAEVVKAGEVKLHDIVEPT